jgi:hypothetical protein
MGPLDSTRVRPPASLITAHTAFSGSISDRASVEESFGMKDASPSKRNGSRDVAVQVDPFKASFETTNQDITS